MKILYICTHNRCRSILSEAVTNHFANGQLQAFSAGSQPVGEVHPLSIKYLSEKGISTEELKSQSWDEFEDIQPDIVVTVCDSAANEACPIWFGDTLQLHWGLEDPSKLEGSEELKREAFFKTLAIIERRVKNLLSLNLENLDTNQKKEKLNSLIKES